MSATDDTIVAVSTPAGRAARAVVRLSGPHAVRCMRARFQAQPGQPINWRRTFRAAEGSLLLFSQPVRVPATVYVMLAPHSYTRQDVVEAHICGSPALVDMVLDDLLAYGPGELRLAEPGEFTRRALLNGRIDLSQAEAVLAVIRSRNEAELAASVRRLQGGAARWCAAVQEQIADLRVQAEASLDFAPHGLEIIGPEEFCRRCGGIARDLASQIRAGLDSLASDGAVEVVICGPPNAGKSSLLNRLAGADRALVHPEAGTTRDPVRAHLELRGVSFCLTDTAGLMEGVRQGPDAEAVRRARHLIRAAQLVVLVLDGSQPLPPGIREEVAYVPPQRLVCVINKCDLPQVLDEATLGAETFAWEVLHVSALTGQGVEELRAALGRVVTEGRLDRSPSECLLNARQRAAARRALSEIRRAARAVRTGLGYEFAALNLRLAAQALAEITGEVSSESVLDRIFSQFCIGK